MNLHLHLPASEVAKSLNLEFQGEVYDSNTDDEFVNDLVRIQVSIDQPFVVETDHNGFKIHAILHVRVKVKGRQQIWNILNDIYFTQIESTEFDIRVDFNVKLDLNNDWTITPTTTGVFTWIRQPHIKIALVKIKISRILTPILKREIDKACQEVNDFITQEVAFQKHIAEVWKIIQQPIEIEEVEDDELWFCLRPLPDAYATPFRTKNGALTMAIGLTTYPEGLLYKPEETDLKPLPDFKRTEYLSEKFSSRMAGEISYEKFAEILTQEPLELEDGHVIQIKRAKVYGKDDTIHLQLHVAGKVKLGPFLQDFEGAIALEGHVYYDMRYHAIKLARLHYEMSTSNVILKIVNRIGKTLITNRLQEEIEAEIAAKIQETEDLIRQAISKNELEEYLMLDGELMQFVPAEVKLNDKGIRMTMRVMGNLNLYIQNLDAIPEENLKM